MLSPLCGQMTVGMEKTQTDCSSILRCRSILHAYLNLLVELCSCQVQAFTSAHIPSSWFKGKRVLGTSILFSDGCASLAGFDTLLYCRSFSSLILRIPKSCTWAASRLLGLTFTAMMSDLLRTTGRILRLVPGDWDGRCGWMVRHCYSCNDPFRIKNASDPYQ